MMEEEGELVENLTMVALEEMLFHEQEQEDAVGLMLGRMGARIVSSLEDGADLLDDDTGDEYWERVEVDMEGYRRMGDPSFRRHFRLRKETYEILIHAVANFLLDSGKIIRIRNSLDVPLLMVLWVLANPDTFRSVALRFGVLPGVVHYHYAYLIETLREMAPMYIKWPTAQERETIKTIFELYSGFPGIVGVIDGTHNVVTAPTVQKDRFRNRHHTYSFNTMVVCDHNLLIRDMHIGEAGSMHDQRVFRRSPLYRMLVDDPQQEMLQPDEHIIGDSAYAVMDCLMVPFRNVGNLTPQQRRYNYRLCKCRARIEHCFGKVFNQWRRMKMLHSCNIELAVDHFTACFVLHNFMILNGEELMDLPDGDVDFDDDQQDEELEDDLLEEDEEQGNFNQLVREARYRGVEKE